jgi:fermentation-respiration switch protein FrsA (DUF1100 family)
MWLIVLLSVVGFLALVALLAVLGISAWVAHNMTLVRKFPNVGQFGHPSQLELAYEDVTFSSRRDRVTLKGWYLPAQPDSRCIIIAAGEQHHRNSPGIKPLLLGRDLVQHGYSVLLFDYRARGESAGKRSSAGDREQWDVLGAMDYVQGRGISLDRIGMIGFSLGAGVAIILAAKEPRIPAIVSDSGFLDSIPFLKRVPFYRVYLPAWFAIPIILVGRVFFKADFSKVRPVKEVGKIAPRPIFFIHGADDHVISPHETEELHRASRNPQNPLWIVPGARHGRGYDLTRGEYVQKVVSFFQSYLK